LIHGRLDRLRGLSLIPGGSLQGDHPVADQHSQRGVPLGDQGHALRCGNSLGGVDPDIHQRGGVHDVPDLGELPVQQPGGGLSLPRRSVPLEADDSVAGSGTGQAEADVLTGRHRPGGVVEHLGRDQSRG
jgi:hypothetical protein